MESCFDGGAAKDFSLELGSKQMIPGFEEALIGVSASDETVITVPFPKDYPSENLAGKEATFKITVHAVETPKLPELNDDLAEKAGIHRWTGRDESRGGERHGA